VNVQDLKTLLGSLRSWSQRDAFTRDDWEAYRKVAKIVQETDPHIVEEALNQFVRDAVQEPFTGYESESKPFLLMRVVFDLPEVSPQQSRLLFKGWVNWPQPDVQGNVSLAWPLSWQGGGGEMVAPYQGSEGKPYDAAAEYRYFRSNFPYRRLA